MVEKLTNTHRLHLAIELSAYVFVLVESRLGSGRETKKAVFFWSLLRGRMEPQPM